MAVSPKQSQRVGQLGQFAQAANHQVASGFPNYPYFQDTTATPVKSPVAVTTAAQLINIPAGAVIVTFISGVALRVSDTSNQANGYIVVPANVPVALPVTTPTSDPNNLSGQMWIAADSTGGNCSFFFSCV